MSDNEKNNLNVTQDSDSSKKLNDNDLENVNGGLFGITILDTCPKQWDKGICWGAIWGACPNLETTFTETTQFEYTDIYKCTKGYFNSVKVVRPAACSTEG